MEKKNALEWIVFYVGLAIVLGLLGYLTYLSIAFEPSPPDIALAYRHEPSTHAPHRFHIVLRNKGNETAEEVQIELVAMKNGEMTENAILNIPFLPKQSAREGWVVLTQDPALADSVYARVISYKKP